MQIMFVFFHIRTTLILCFYSFIDIKVYELDAKLDPIPFVLGAVVVVIMMV